jgi:hypothetical protein
MTNTYVQLDGTELLRNQNVHLHQFRKDVNLGNLLRALGLHRPKAAGNWRPENRCAPIVPAGGREMGCQSARKTKTVE